MERDVSSIIDMPLDPIEIIESLKISIQKETTPPYKWLPVIIILAHAQWHLKYDCGKRPFDQESAVREE